MANVTIDRVIHAPLSQVWASWDAFGDFAAFNPALKASRTLEGSPATGLRARRHCDMKDGKTFVQEEIVGYQPEAKLSIKVIKGNMPLKSAIAEVTFQAQGSNATRVRFAMDFEPKGIMGQLMTPMMKAIMRKTIANILAGNARYLKQPEMARAA